MGEKRDDTGFTVIEVIVATIVIGLFAIIFFQSYITNTKQQAAVLQRAAADDIALNNLKKVISRTSPILTQSSVACSTASATSGPGNPNNVVLNSAAGKTTVGSNIGSVAAGATPGVGQFARESLAGTNLGTDTTGTAATTGTKQTMVVLYPRGCEPSAYIPIQVKSIVEYDTSNGRDRATRAIFINQ